MSETKIGNETGEVMNIPFKTYMEMRLPNIDRELQILKAKVVELEKERTTIEDFARMSKIYRTGSAKSHRARASEVDCGDAPTSEQEAGVGEGKGKEAELETRSSDGGIKAKVSIKQAIMMVLNEHYDGLSAKDINPMVDAIRGEEVKPSSLWPQLTRLKDVERVLVNEDGIWKKKVV
ncbi:MAG: hypothetical protein OEL76_14480 [Siculibacillus sp.]|nr:hypothetical protein [Siculibacillus sp.]